LEFERQADLVVRLPGSANPTQTYRACCFSQAMAVMGSDGSSRVVEDFGAGSVDDVMFANTQEPEKGGLDPLYSSHGPGSGYSHCPGLSMAFGLL
jgi:hypothetical protein